MASSSPSAVTKKQPQQVAQQQEDGYLVEEKESSASANASAGLNLNLFGALSGAFSSKKSSTTAADGSSLETKEEQAGVRGAGKGNGQAIAAGDAQVHDRKMKEAAAVAKQG